MGHTNTLDLAELLRRVLTVKFFNNDDDSGYRRCDGPGLELDSETINLECS
jgi:hypothetical protein